MIAKLILETTNLTCHIVFRTTIVISDLSKQHFTIFRSVWYICVFRWDTRDKRLYESELSVRIDKIFKDATCPQTVMGNVLINEIWVMKENSEISVYVQRVLWIDFLMKNIRVRDVKSNNWNQYTPHYSWNRTYIQAAIINDQRYNFDAI